MEGGRDRRGMSAALVTSALTARSIESLGDGDLDGLKVLFVAFKEFRSTSVHGCVM